MTGWFDGGLTVSNSLSNTSSFRVILSSVTFRYLFDKFKRKICYIRVDRVVTKLSELFMSCLELKLRIYDTHKLSLKPFGHYKAAFLVIFLFV